MTSTPSPSKVQKKKLFLERYESGPRAYFRREGAILMAVITILLVGAGSFALSGTPLGVGYLFLLAGISLAIAFVGTFLTYHYKLTQAHKTLASVQELPAFHTVLEQTHGWQDATIYVPPPMNAPSPPAPVAALRV